MPQKANELVADEYSSFLFKGPPGFGKTLAACSFALLGPTYLAYFDKKKPIEIREFFRKFGDKGKTILDNLVFDQYSSKNPHEYVNHLMKLSNDCRYVCHITDSVTRFTACAVNWSLNFNSKGKSSTAQEIIDSADVIPDFDDYKVETSLVAQALDLCNELPCHVIWIAHPVPSIKIEGSGSSIRVTKTNPIVTYGSKAAGMIPPNFTEIYHFSQQTDFSSGSASKKYIAMLDSVGDDFGRSPLLGDYIKEIDFTGRFFYEVWKEKIEDKNSKDPSQLSGQPRETFRWKPPGQ